MVDFARVRARCADGVAELDVEELRSLDALFRGPFIAGLDLPGQPGFETWRLGQQQQARQLHLLVLDALAARLEPSERAAALRRRIDLDPGDEAAHARLIAALAQSGAMAEAEAQKQASARMLGAIGPFDHGALDFALRSKRAATPPVPAPIELDAPLRQDVRFCTRQGRRARGLRDGWLWAAFGEVRQLAQSFGVRLGQPDLALLLPRHGEGLHVRAL